MLLMKIKKFNKFARKNYYTMILWQKVETLKKVTNYAPSSILVMKRCAEGNEAVYAEPIDIFI